MRRTFDGNPRESRTFTGLDGIAVEAALPLDPKALAFWPDRIAVKKSVR
jgi:hypothetical protein